MKQKIQKFNEMSTAPFDVEASMKKCVEYYTFIEEEGVKIAAVCEELIAPLLAEKKFDEAKTVVRNFYNPARYGGSEERQGDIILIDCDMILANINKLIRANK